MKATILGGDLDSLTGDERCLYTVSVDPSGMREGSILAGFEWVKRTFRNVTPLIGDGPLIERTARITGADPELVERRALVLSDRLPGAVLMSRLVLDEDFTRAMERVSAATTTCAGFREGIDEEAGAYVARVARRGGLAIKAEEAARISREYIELEVAMYLCMASRGWLVDVYVGRELNILKRFIAQEFGLLLSPLERRVFIGLEGETAT